jgi:hypothetical protein
MRQLNWHSPPLVISLLLAVGGGSGCGGGSAAGTADGGAAGRADTGNQGGPAGQDGGDRSGAAGAGGGAGEAGKRGMNPDGAAGTGPGGAAGANPGGAAGTGPGGAAGAGPGGAAGTGAGAAGAGTAGVGGAVNPRCQGASRGDLQLGTAKDDQVLGMTVDADDNLIVSGYEQGIVGVTNIEPDGDARAAVFKIGPDGTTIWKTILDTSGTDTAEDVAVDRATGNLVVVGRTSGAFPTFTNQGQFDLFVALLAPSGQLETLLQAGNERPQHPARLSLGPGGKVLVAGWDDTYIPSNYVAANEDGFVAAFSIATGAGAGQTITQTAMQYAFPSSMTGPFSFATGVAAEQDGSGAGYVTTLVASSRSPENGISVSKLDAQQALVWDQVLSPDSFDAVNAVALSPTGDLFVTGGTFHTLGAQAFGQEDAFLMKLDRATGAPVWIAQAGGPDSDYPTALAFDAAGNIYVAGITLGSVIAGVPNQGSSDLFAMKFSPAGALVSVWQRGTPDDDELTSVAVDSCGRVFVGGYTRGALVNGQANLGGEDMFILDAAL